MQFYLHIHSIYIIAHMFGMHYMQKHSVDCMLHGSQKHSAHRKAQRFE